MTKKQLVMDLAIGHTHELRGRTIAFVHIRKDNFPLFELSFRLINWLSYIIDLLDFISIYICIDTFLNNALIIIFFSSFFIYRKKSSMH